MKKLTKLFLISSLFVFFSCEREDFTQEIEAKKGKKSISFSPKTSIYVDGEESAEISAYDAKSKQLFTTDSKNNVVHAYDISKLPNYNEVGIIDLSGFGAVNSVAVAKGKLAIAVEAPVKQDNGKVLVFDTGKLTNPIATYTVGALPDMVEFSKNGRFIVTANEGEPNDDYTNDPDGTVSIIDLSDNSVNTLDFSTFNGMEAALEAQGFRVFGPGADLAADVEPEYITIAEDNRTAWVALQENNGIAKFDLITKSIIDIYPLGFKDHSLPGNELDASNKDDVKELKNWPVLGIYQPDGITYVKIHGQEFVISANEGDAREYDRFEEEDRIKDLDLDATAFPDAAFLQDETNLGRLKTTLTLGDVDNDGDFDKLYSYGARSFSIWSINGDLVYDSGSSIAQETLNATPETFNDDDGRSDDKGAEPEAVTVLKIANQYILFVGLERTDQVLMYDITNPYAPTFLDILSNSGDEAPEGLLVIPAKESPTKRDLLVVSNEDSGTVTFYEN